MTRHGSVPRSTERCRAVSSSIQNNNKQYMYCYTLDVILGCQWSNYTDWSQCSKTCGGGFIKRVREKLPGIGTIGK